MEPITDDPTAEMQSELSRIEDDIENLRKFKKEHKHDPKVPEAVDKLIYALIVQKNRINSGNFYD